MNSESSTRLPLDQRPAWKALQNHFQSIGTKHLRDLFAEDPARGQRFTAEAGGLFLDYSKNRITDETLRLLVSPRRTNPACATASKPCSAATRSTSPRTAPSSTSPCATAQTDRILVDGKDVMPEVNAVLDHMAAFSDRVRSGAWKGYTGKPIRNVVNIGIGGSDLGPVMAYEALKPLLASATSPSASSPTSTAPTSPRPSSDLDPERPSSSSPPRPSPRRRP